MSEDLPSINSFLEDRETLPSVQEYSGEQLPSLNDFVEIKEEVIVETPVEEEERDNSTDIIISLIESVRNSIPEVKSYDKELYELVQLIEEVRKEIPVVPEPPVIPEVKYYDDEIQELKESIPVVPEVKYYDAQIDELKESIQEVKDRDIPDFRWIGNSFNAIDSDFETLSTSLAALRGKLDLEINDISESIETKTFENKVDFNRLDKRVDDTEEENLKSTITETKDKIYQELRETSLKIWALNKEYKQDDKNLKKEIGEQYKKLKVKIEDSIKESNTKTGGKIDKLNEYFKYLVEEIENLPEVKYYDEQIEDVNQSIQSVKNLVEVLENKLNKKIAGLKESILVVPPTENNTDPLTPLDQNFATLDDLSNHYRLFLNRIQQQLATLGGGGETRLEFLDDVDRDSVKVDGKVIAYQASTGKFIGVTNSGGGGGSGITTAEVRDAIQGYYGYTTDYYTTGVANTTQTIGAGVTTLIEPQVAAVYQHLPTIMTGVGTNPFIGNTATTIGTGQTEFSLAGLSSGASCIVRTALAFDPDEDNTNLDIQLKFTTNTATQGTGLTNFVILKENALIMQVGGDQQYISENLFSFFVGTTLEGTTYDNAGSFSIEVIPSNDGELEVLAVTVSIVA